MSLFSQLVSALSDIRTASGRVKLARLIDSISGSGAVSSVFGRTGAVIAQAGDYAFSQLASIPTTLAGYGITDAVPSARTLTVGPTTQDLSADRTFLPNVTNDAQTKASIFPNTAPSAGQIPIGALGSSYAPQTISGSGATITCNAAGVISISAIGNASLQNSSITIAGTATALGAAISLDTILGLAANGFVRRTGANALTVDSIGQLSAEPSNASASAGKVGEFVQSLVATGLPAVALTSGVNANITSISLTAGDWDVEGQVILSYISATQSGDGIAAINTTSAALVSDGSEGYSGLRLTAATANDSITLFRKRISLSATTTVFLVARASFSAGSAKGAGGISARRVR